jgi:hypothetical protein
MLVAVPLRDLLGPLVAGRIDTIFSLFILIVFLGRAGRGLPAIKFMLPPGFEPESKA